MCPRGRRLLGQARIVCHVLLIERADGLVLVDTGFGSEDVRNPRQIAAAFRGLMRPQLQAAETAVSQVRGLGLDPEDVRDVVLTHLDVDHSGGLPDFPGARVHVFAREHDAMMRPPLRERTRYAIAAPHWAHSPRWVPHEPGGDQWRGFESVRVLPGGDEDVLLIPLPGHTVGHSGVAARRGEGWLLHCGDAFFHRDEVATPARCPVGLRVFQTLVQANGKLRLANQERLRELARERSNEVQLICSHDPAQLEQAQGSG
jgi:glyoxylase-like metal-dependent hydrolase (beta-lactamase superfamily II)